jgi:hypothetical protein
LDSPKKEPASHSGLYSELGLGGSTWVDGSGRPAGVILPARAVSFTGDEVSRGSRGKGRGDAAEGGRRGLPLAALSDRRRPAARCRNPSVTETENWFRRSCFCCLSAPVWARERRRRFVEGGREGSRRRGRSQCCSAASGSGS